MVNDALEIKDVSPGGNSFCTDAPSPNLSTILFELRGRLYTGYGGNGLCVAGDSAQKGYLFQVSGM